MVGRVKQPAKGKVAWSILTTLLTLLAFFCASHTQAGESARPNVVFMLADNLGYGDLGVYGGGETRGFRTPRIDRLAGEGLRFTQFLVEPGCTPTRAALLTGRYSIRSGLSLVIVPGTPNTLAEQEVTLGELFKSQDYSTAYFGKWHVGTEKQSLPHNQGFDQWYGIPNTTDETFYVPTSNTAKAPLPEMFSRPAILKADAGGEAEFVKEYDYESRRSIDFEIAERSVEFIEEQAGSKRPFFLLVSWTRPHEPNKPSVMFEGKSRIGDYGDAIMELDFNTGRVLDAIDRAGVRENTIVVWASDNGPTRTTSWPDSGFAGPYRGELGSSLEGSIRTAGMVRWPGKIEPRVSNEMISIMDFFPTFANIIEAPVPADRPMDGVDQTGFFLGGQANSNREHLLTFAGDRLQSVRWRQFRVYFVDQGASGTSAEFQYGLGGSYKMLDYPKVFNIELDPREEHNVSSQHGWVMSHAFRLIGDYKASLKVYPNPPAPNLTAH